MTGVEGFGRRLAQERRAKAARDERDIDQKDVAEAIGTSSVNVSRWESGQVVPGDDNIQKLAEYFGVTPGWLRYGVGDREVRRSPITGIELPPREKTKPLVYEKGKAVPLKSAETPTLGLGEAKSKAKKRRRA